MNESSGEAVSLPAAGERRGASDDGALILRNEFAYVSVSLHDPGGRPRLRIEDLRTQQTVELDPIELESLAWASHHDLTPLLDPSLTRWANDFD
jgi:hypothetical protein